jgi:peptide deformylase
MAILDILHFPDPRLRKKAAPVKSVTDKTRQLIENMLETMYDAPGVGLAATQVNVHLRIVVIDISEEKDQAIALINPEIIKHEGDILWKEGCLSVPEYYEEIHRSEKVTVKALNPQGEQIQIDAEGLLAVCIQHELDHLLGKLFVDYLSGLKRQRILKKFKKLQDKA